MEWGLRKVIKDIPVGKVLIDHSPINHDPILHFVKLPQDINERYVFILDSQLASGASALMAIKVALDHNVPQDKIIFMALVASPLGVSNILKAFPKVHIISSALEDFSISDGFFILNSFGDFGDRYFGT
jgi:uridine kinase